MVAEQDQVSITALGASLMRALHTRDDEYPLIDDPWGDRLVHDDERERVAGIVLAALPPDRRAEIERLGSSADVLAAALRAHPGYGWAIVRTRYAEDALRASVARGVQQYVIVGAGFDSFALRRPDFARDVAIFEVDHPATQTLKQRRLRDCGVTLPTSSHFVAADLSREDLATALARSAFRRGAPTFFSWLGVSQYLTREANIGALRDIAGCGASSSELVFTYVETAQLAVDRPSEAVGRLRGAFASAREPWLSGFDPSRLPLELRAVGLTLVEDLDGVAAGQRYQRAGATLLTPLASSHIARATTAAG